MTFFLALLLFLAPPPPITYRIEKIERQTSVLDAPIETFELRFVGGGIVTCIGNQEAPLIRDLLFGIDELRVSQ